MYFLAEYMDLENTTKAIGVDLGITSTAVTSNNLVYKNINKTKRVKKLKKKLKRNQKALSRKKLNKGGANTNRKKNILKIQKIYYRLSSIRLEYNKYVVNSLVKNNPQFIAIEDLNIKGMMKNKHLSRSISEQCLYQLKTFLIWKCKKLGIEVREINRFYPSSKTCSSCGVIKKDLKLSDRTYKCSCGNHIDRDLNASINLKNCLDFKVL